LTLVTGKSGDPSTEEDLSRRGCIVGGNGKPAPASREPVGAGGTAWISSVRPKPQHSKVQKCEGAWLWTALVLTEKHRLAKVPRKQAKQSEKGKGTIVLWLAHQGSAIYGGGSIPEGRERSDRKLDAINAGEKAAHPHWCSKGSRKRSA